MLALAVLLALSADGFVPLFNGKTLDGWVPVNAAPGTFSVKDGCLATTGVPTGLLRSAKRYENFILEAEWMHVVPKGNSGLFMWADPLPAVGTPFTRAVEVQVLDGIETKDYTSDGDVFAIWGAKLKPDRPHPKGWMRCLPSEKRSKPAGQWNHYRVECNDGVIKLAVNGKVVSGASACSPRMGYICVEAEGSECRFRNLKIKELPSTKPKPEECAPEAKGHRTLFTGIDLKGWKAEEAKRWTVDSTNNKLKHTGKGESALASEKKFKEFELILDKKDGGFLALKLWNKAILVLSLGEENGKWSRYVIRMEKGAIKVTRNGKPADIKSRMPPGDLTEESRIILLPNGPVDLCNLFIRELK